MLFNEIYGNYYNVIAAVLARAVEGDLTDAALVETVREKAFAESVLTIPAALKSGAWPLLTPELETPLRVRPTMPLTTLQRRWLKTLLADPRIRLFSLPERGLEDVEPLCPPDAFVYYDRYADGDPYDSPDYVRHFRTLLTALRERRRVLARFYGRYGKAHSASCLPCRLEYSSKDDKFRLFAKSAGGALIINVARIVSCRCLEPYAPEEARMPEPVRERLVLELVDRRNALERAMLHFSHLEKETERIDEQRYRITLQYDGMDETELLIRVLSFGPMLRVVEPQRFIDKLRGRLDMQAKRLL